MTAEQVTAFVVRESRLRPASLPPTVTALRSLLRFLHVDGAVCAGLADAVPTARARRLAGLPKALTGGQVAAMLATCDQATAAGRRNLAILTLLSRLGLRIGGVAALRLDDIDWRRGEIIVAGKGTRHERLPLPGDAGSAIVAYLQDGRPETSYREVFLCVHGPYRPMHPATVSNVAEAAARRAGLGLVHAHRLRRSAATCQFERRSRYHRHRPLARTRKYRNHPGLRPRGPRPQGTRPRPHRPDRHRPRPLPATGHDHCVPQQPVIMPSTGHRTRAGRMTGDRSAMPQRRASRCRFRAACCREALPTGAWHG